MERVNAIIKFNRLHEGDAVRTTMLDVASQAGVDKATVSRVLRGDYRISEKTRQKVMEVVRALHYRPNRSARNLSTNKSALVSLVAADFDAPWFGSFLSGVDRAIAHSDFELLVKCTGGSQLRARAEAVRLSDINAEGVIWCDGENFPASFTFPVVTIGFEADSCFSLRYENGLIAPTFELGVTAGRFLLNLIAGKPVPSRSIVVRDYAP